MSLTSHLKDTSSPIRRFLLEQFPNVRALAREISKALRTEQAVRPSGSSFPYSTVGMALDYRLRYYFDHTPSQNLVAWDGASLLRPPQWADADDVEPLRADGLWLESYAHTGERHMYRVSRGKVQRLVSGNAFYPDTVPPFRHPQVISEFFGSLDNLLQHIKPAKKRLERADEELLNRHCIVLALFEEVARMGLDRAARASVLFRQAFATVSDLTRVAESTWVDDLCQLSWLFYDGYGELLSGPAVLNPTFDGSADIGGADADLIVNGCLVDIKTTLAASAHTWWVYELLGYVLLDYSNHYQMSSIALYLARQGLLLRWDVSEVIKACSGKGVSQLEALREQFSHVAKNVSRHLTYKQDGRRG